MTHVPSAGKYRPIGQLLVDLGYLGTEDLKRVLKAQKDEPEGNKRSVGALCVEMGYLSKERLDFILERWGKRLKLGELLVNRGRIAPRDLDWALAEQKKAGGKLGEVLVNMGLIDETALAEVLAEQFDLPSVSLVGMRPRPELGRFINPLYASRYGVVPIGRVGSLLMVATSDPARREVKAELEQSTGLRIEMVVAPMSEVAAFARSLYEFGNADPRAASASSAGGEEKPTVPGMPPPSVESPEELSDRLGRILTDAITQGAGELHIRHDGAIGQTRLRVGSLLRDWTPLGGSPVAARALMRTLKEMAGLDVAEARGTQEGVLVARGAGGGPSDRVALRMTLTSGPEGETAALHFLDESRAVPPLDQIGLRDTVCAELESVLEHAGGVILIAGPKGSGKRTTLRALLGRLVARGKVVDTIEDPILYPIEGVFQAQVDARRGCTYMHHLERILALNPDAVLIDRIGEGALAELAFTGAAGHPLIACTIQASGGAAAAARVLQLGVDPALVASSLRAVLSQRLLRRNCPHCLVTYRPEASVIDDWFTSPPVGQVWWRGRGCERCQGTGFLHRIRVAEFWRPSDDERRWIAQRVEEPILQQRILERIGCHGQDALAHACEGRTTLEEAMRIVPYEEIAFTRSRGPSRPMRVSAAL
ncbi:MAG: hypothetical protein FJY88_10850 [Candidatus Eisenbacteria bacterium]|nr:hypothetical protein [Candidatus Eisenbacteria bacterium]